MLHMILLSLHSYYTIIQSNYNNYKGKVFIMSKKQQEITGNTVSIPEAAQEEFYHKFFNSFIREHGIEYSKQVLQALKNDTNKNIT